MSGGRRTCGTVGELQLIELVEQGAVVVDSRTAGSFGGCTLPGSIKIAHTEILDRKDEFEPGRLTIRLRDGVNA
jgi:rhodanese-related sulfurtransferase